MNIGALMILGFLAFIAILAVIIFVLSGSIGGLAAAVSKPQSNAYQNSLPSQESNLYNLNHPGVEQDPYQSGFYGIYTWQGAGYYLINATPTYISNKAYLAAINSKLE